MSSVVISGDTSGTVTLSAPAVAGTNTLSLQAATATNAINTWATAKTPSSGTTIDFTGIPSWVRRITVSFGNIIQTGTTTLIVQIGSGSIENTGYVSGLMTVNSSGLIATTSSTAGYAFMLPYSAGQGINGSVVLTNISGNIWVSSGAITMGTSGGCTSGGSKTASGVIDRLTITTTTGTPTFSSGTVNLYYEA